MVYYATHPIFMTDKAIYILTCDLSRDPYQQASIPEREGLYKKANDINFSYTNMDCLDYWLSSIYSLASSNASSLASALPEMSSTKLPPVFLVCTHADKPYTDGPDEHPNARRVALDIYGFLQTKSYRDHLFHDVFVVDNTKAGSENDCQEVIRLREEILAVAKKLPHLKQAIPLKWLKYENELYRLREEGHKWIPREKAMDIAFGTCGLRDNEEFSTATNFLHDQRILIHFSGHRPGPWLPRSVARFATMGESSIRTLSLQKMATNTSCCSCESLCKCTAPKIRASCSSMAAGLQCCNHRGREICS